MSMNGSAGFGLDRRIQLEREADAIAATIDILRSKGHQAWIASNEQGAPVMQTTDTVPAEAVLEAIALSWIRMGEPARKLRCIHHFMKPRAEKCRLLTCLVIAQNPGAGCER